jgi:uncharacterized protein YebE (UPF0316 family)
MIIFWLRVIDVSLGTVKTISVVKGKTKTAVFVGFVEVTVWLVAVSQVITNLQNDPFLILAYASGYATGNAVGIWLEKKLAMGAVNAYLISRDHSREIVNMLRENGLAATSFRGEGKEGDYFMIYTACDRKNFNNIIKMAKKIDPKVFYTAEAISENSPLFDTQSIQHSRMKFFKMRK